MSERVFSSTSQAVASKEETTMRKFAIVMSVLAAALFVGGTAQAQSLSGQVRVGNGNGSAVQLYASSHRDHNRFDNRHWNDNRRFDNRNWNNRGWDNRGWNGRSGVDIRIGGGSWGVGVYSGPRWGSPVYRNYPRPIYRDPCGYSYGCGGGSDAITVRVQETYVDQWGRVNYTGRVLLYTAYYDYRYGAYVYVDQYGQTRIAR
jgi:hypothetical protein